MQILRILSIPPRKDDVEAQTLAAGEQIGIGPTWGGIAGGPWIRGEGANAAARLQIPPSEVDHENRKKNRYRDRTIAA